MSAVGTLGYKSPEGSMYCIGNSLDVMPSLSTKADIFGFGLVMSLLFLNQDGPKSMRELGQLVLSVNQTVGPKQTLTQQQQDVLRKNKIRNYDSCIKFALFIDSSLFVFVKIELYV